MKRTVSACGAYVYGASATRTASAPVGASVLTATRSASVSVLETQLKRCRNGCGWLYKDWYDELVCPICGYHEYIDEE